MKRIRAVTHADAHPWLRMRHALWPDEEVADLKLGIDRFFAGYRHEPKEVLLAIDSQGSAIGFVELSIRNIVDSCDTDHVAYLEGWYVDPHARRQGVGRLLISAAEQWARKQGCTEFGSDALAGNELSAAAHVALGFEETGCVRNFRKTLTRRAT